MTESRSQMSVVFVVPRYHTNMLGWVRALQKCGHEVFVLTDKIKGKSDTSDVVPVHIREEEQTWKNIAAFLQQCGSDAVVVRNPRSPLSKATLKAAQKMNLRIVLYTQGPHYRRNAWIERLTIAFLQKRLGGAPWITPVRGDDSTGIRPLDNWHYIPFVVQLDSDSQEKLDGREWFRGGVCRIVMVAKYMKRKNHLLLIQALEELAGKLQFRLHLIGGGYVDFQEQVRSYVSEHALDWVHFVPPMSHAELQMSHAELQQRLWEYDLFVLPSRDEPVSVSVLEAMSKGLPVVCSTTCGAKYYVEDGGNGSIFQSDDKEDLRRCLAGLIENRAGFESMGRRSMELVREFHSPEAFMQQFLPLIERN